MSSRKKIPLSAPIYRILVVDALDGFTVKDFRDAYVDFLSLGSTPEELGAYRKVYRQTLRLQKHGLLEKMLKNGEPAKYHRTPLFYETTFVEMYLREDDPSEQFEVLSEPAVQQQPLIAQLQAKAHQYQVDLLASIGESEEYQRLSKEYPKIRHHFEAEFHSARERSSKLLGQLKAIKTVITQYSEEAS